MASSGFSRRASVMASFDNLVALANYQEALRDARKMVWRDRGEPAIELHTFMECLEHAGRGGIRAGTLGFTLRSGFNLFVLLFRISRTPRQFRYSLIRHALLGEECFRFAAMLGSFVAVYKLIVNALPILVPPAPRHRSPFSPTSSPTSPDDIQIPMTMAPTRSERRKGRLSFRAQAREIWMSRQTRWWYSAVAGAFAGGIGISFEKRSRAIVIAQQLFVRGLQGSYNAFSTKHNFKIPNGDVVVFSLCCAQIMYAFLLRPDTIPHSYNAWIQNASRVPLQSVLIHRSLLREGTFDPANLQLLMNRKTTTAANATRLFERLSAASATGEFGSRFVPCEGVHPWLDSCVAAPFERFVSVFRWMFPIYGALHLVPAVLFKRAAFFERPWDMIARAGWGTIRSSAFLGTFVAIFQAFFCTNHNLHNYLSSSKAFIKLQQKWIDLLLSRPAYWCGGLLSGLSLFVEAKRRRGELAMYVLPKGMESAWIMARGKGYVFRTGEFGERLLCAIGMGMVMSTYQNHPEHLSGLVRRILYQFVGPN